MGCGPAHQLRGSRAITLVVALACVTAAYGSRVSVGQQMVANGLEHHSGSAQQQVAGVDQAWDVQRLFNLAVSWLGQGRTKQQQNARKYLQQERIAKLTAEARADWVPSLPGWGPVDDFDLFAGYITVDEKAGRALFYVLAQSKSDYPEDDPLVLWLNGGPGCSSLGNGFMSELGPWYPLPGGRKLQANPHAWHKFAHMLFLESPAFVGFSYSNTTSDAIVGDGRTAADSRKFLLGFLERFPQYKDTPLYLSGESYAGHYVPTLALAIVEGNKAAAATAAETATADKVQATEGAGPGAVAAAAAGSAQQQQRINLQGFLLGNPWTDAAIDNLGAVDYWWSHALISDETANGIRANCNFSRIGPLDPHPEHAQPKTRDDFCDDFCNRAFTELGPINIYQIYADVCLPSRLRGQVEALAHALGPHHPAGLAHRAAVAARAARTSETVAAQAEASKHQDGGKAHHANDDDDDDVPNEPSYDPCIDDEVEQYVNWSEVQIALHANVSGNLPGRWSSCTRNILYSREDLLSSMLPVYAKLLKANLRMLVFSGDVDGIVPVVGTRRWTSGLRLQEKAAWRPWTSATGQVGGYIVDYANGLSFATVRNAGHMVPYTQPERGQYMAKAFFHGQEI